MCDFVLIMVDECGDEVEVERFTFHLDLDEDEVLIWQERKIEKARERYPEARRFYFEDRRGWGAMINELIHGTPYDYDDEEEDF